MKRLEWAKEHLSDGFKHVIWTDKCFIQLQTHQCFCCRKKGESPNQNWGRALLLCTKNPNLSDFVHLHRAKHPVKVDVWAGISLRGSTETCVFSGIMDVTLYIKILNDTLLPFIHNTYPEGHRLMQDNDLKHTFRQACAFIGEKGISRWKTVQSLWH